MIVPEVMQDSTDKRRYGVTQNACNILLIVITALEVGLLHDSSNIQLYFHQDNVYNQYMELFPNQTNLYNRIFAKQKRNHVQ